MRFIPVRTGNIKEEMREIAARAVHPRAYEEHVLM